MKKVTSLFAIAFACATVGVAAQGAPPSTQQPAGAPPAAQQPGADKSTAKPDASMITVTGCLQRDAAAAASSEKTADASFILTEASTGAAAPPGAAPSSGGQTPGTAGTTGSTSSSGKMSYALEGTNLATNVGRRVEVRGTVMAAAGASAAPGGAAAAARQRLQVSSIRTVEGTCTPAAPTAK